MKQGNLYRGYFQFRGKSYYTGWFDTPEEAYLVKELMRGKVIAEQRRATKTL